MRTKDLDKQKRIKAAVVELILREGIDGASVAKIAREAGVSPATIYVYYTSKEDMLSEVFREYSRMPYRYMISWVSPGMGGAELIDSLIRACYDFSVEHQEVFSFVEQCSRCPSLYEEVSETECCCDILDVIHAYQERGTIRRMKDVTMSAVLFEPVKLLAMRRDMMDDAESYLDELSEMLRRMLLT